MFCVMICMFFFNKCTATSPLKSSNQLKKITFLPSISWLFSFIITTFQFFSCNFVAEQNIFLAMLKRETLGLWGKLNCCSATSACICKSTRDLACFSVFSQNECASFQRTKLCLLLLFIVFVVDHNCHLRCVRYMATMWELRRSANRDNVSLETIGFFILPKVKRSDGNVSIMNPQKMFGI